MISFLAPLKIKAIYLGVLVILFLLEPKGANLEK
jgi:hypothetical protein